MGVGFGGHAVFNRASPSSYERCVARILADFLPKGRPARILDIGGTADGFRAHAALPPGSRLVIANPQQGVGADYGFVQDMPPDEANFDLAMLFGVMMYLDRAPLLALLREAKQRLRGDGTLLIAEPDSESVLGWVDMQAKRALTAAFGSILGARLTYHKVSEVTALLREAGFFQVSPRADLTPNAMGVLPPPMPRYYVLAARV